MKLKNERGVTLVELLAVLVLVSMVATLILTTFFIANRYHLTETRKLKLQQDANYVVTSILQRHRTVRECYELEINIEKKLVFIDCDTLSTEIVIGDSYQYELTNLVIGDASPVTLKDPGVKVKVYPRKKDVHVTVKVMDPNNTNLFVLVNTAFKRYKTKTM